MASLGSFSVEVLANIARFTSDMGKAQAIANKNAKDIQRALSQVGALIGVTFTAGALVTFLKRTTEAAGALADMSQKVGVSVEALSTLGFAAGQSGVGIEQLQGGLVKLAKNASDAAQGTGDAVNAFAAMGISVKDAEGDLKNTDVLLREIAGKFATYEDSAQKTALAVKVFGRAGAELIPLLNEGAEGIAEFEERARSLGLEISTNTAQQAELLGDQVDQLKGLMTGLGNDIMTAVLPSLLGFTQGMVDGGIEGRKFSQVAENIKASMDFMLVAFIKGVEAVQNIGAAFGFLVDVIGKVSDAMKASAGPMATYFDAVTDALSGDFSGAAEKYAAAFKQAQEAGKEFGLSIKTAADTLEGSFAANAEEAQKKIDAMSDSSLKLSDALDETGESAKGAAPGIVDMAKAAAESEKALKELLRELEKLEKQYDKELLEAEALRIETERLAREQAAHFAEQAKGLENEITLLGLTGDAREAMAVQIDAERMARDRNGNVMEEERKKLVKLLTEYQKFSKLESVLSRFRDTGLRGMVKDIELIEEALKKGADAFGNAFSAEKIEEMKTALGGLRQETLSFATDAIGQGISSLKSMAAEGTKAYKAMETAQLALNVVTAIGAVVNQGKGDPYTAFARMAAMAAAVAALVGNIAFNGGSGGFSDTSAQRQESQGTGTVLGDMEAKSESIANAIETTADATTQLVGINLGMLRALQAMQAAIGGASGQLARGAGNVEFSALPKPSSLSFLAPFGGGILQSLLGGSSEVTDQGILIMGGALGDMIENISVGAFQEVQSRSWRFGSRRTREEVRALGGEVAVQFQLVLDSMADAVREGAEALGLNMEEINAAIEAFRIEEIRISTMDLSAEEAQAELEAVFSSIFDGLAGSVVPFIEQFQQVGEGLGETLIRVATGVQVTQEALIQLGFALDETDPERFAQISEGLIGLVGGVDEFISGMQTFVNAFATEEHRFMVAQDALNRALGQFGLAIPETRDAMWALMQSLDATTEEGREQIATLLRLAGVADSYYSMLEDRTEDVAEANDALIRSYAEFIDQFGATGSPFQSALQAVRAEMQANIDTANELARAAGMQGAREEDLLRIREQSQRQMTAMIADLTATVIQQIGELYGTSAQQLQDRIAAIDAEIESLTSTGGAHSLMQRLFAESQLNAERLGLTQQLEQQRAAEEALRRQTSALDLAQNLADLTLARGITFEDLAAELGLDLGRFGADLGITGDAVGDLIRTLEAESLTADVFGDGVQRIVDAIMAGKPDGLYPKPWVTLDPMKPILDRDGKAMRSPYALEADEEVRQLLRSMDLRLSVLEPIAANTGRGADAQEGLVSVARTEALRGVTEESRLSPRRKPGLLVQ